MRRGAQILVLLCALASSREANAVRFGLGVATELTPIIVDEARDLSAGSSVRLGFRPVIEVEANHYFAVGVYAPFVVYRSGEASGAASSGAESVFGLTLSGRWPILRDSGPEEILLYGTLRGGFGTVEGRAGPFYGLAIGASAAWIETGRGLFAELGLSHLTVGGIAGMQDVDRNMLGLTMGVVFHLGGEDWRLGRKPVADE